MTDPIPTDPVRDWERAVYDFLAADVPDAVRDRGATVVADVLSAAVGGMAAPANREVAAGVAFADGPATVLGTDRRLDVGQAALLNTAAAITQEMEEGHDTGGHVGASIVAGAVGVAEAADVSGERFVGAVVRAYEVCTRLEHAIFAMKDRLNAAGPWLLRDPHSTWTTVGPALTAAQCLGLDRDGLREAFRVAANLAVVSMHDPYAEGAPARNFTAGFSAQAGVDAARTAAAGLRGSAAAVERVYDPFTDLLDGAFEASFAALGDAWHVTEGYHKPYPSCRYTHAPLDALRDAGVDDLDPDDVAAVTVHTHEKAADMAHDDPRTMTAAKFSTPYVLARHLVSGDVSLAHFEPDALDDPTVRALAERVSLTADPTLEAAFPERWGARVEVELADGSVRVGERAYPRGDHRDPLSSAAFRERTAALLDLALADAEPALAALEDVRSRPVADVVATLRP